MSYDAFPMAGQLSKYFSETRRPVYSAALVLPFFLLYHFGTVFLQTTFINGADALIMRFLSALSVHSMFASALVLLGCFVLWQLRTGASWKIDVKKLLPLYAESLFFALLLYFFFGWLSLRLRLVIPGSGGMENLVLYCGAGIYEELLFRGFLLGGLVLLLRRLMRSKPLAVTLAAVASALIFALFHYLGPSGDPFSAGSFLQRTLAGLYFSALFVTRGFGVTASSHALYDIFVGFTLT